jgi:hypothetical protein
MKHVIEWDMTKKRTLTKMEEFEREYIISQAEYELERLGYIDEWEILEIVRLPRDIKDMDGDGGSDE